MNEYQLVSDKVDPVALMSSTLNIQHVFLVLVYIIKRISQYVCYNNVPECVLVQLQNVRILRQ